MENKLNRIIEDSINQKTKEMKNLIEKLILIQSELKAPKGQRNNFGNYNYRSCEDILEAVKPHLKNQDLFLSITDELINVGQRYYVQATVLITDGVDRWTTNGIAREEETKKGMDGSQITGASSSYARKYALNGMFGIDDAKDSDSTNQHDKTSIPAKPELKPTNGEAVQMANLLKVAIAEVGIAKDNERLKSIWEAYPMFHSDSNFKSTINAKKTELSK